MHGLLALLLLIPLSVSAIPQTLSYQGYLTDTAGAPLNGTQGITFKLYNVNSGKPGSDFSFSLWSGFRGQPTSFNKN